jgi:hypothetical protein
MFYRIRRLALLLLAGFVLSSCAGNAAPTTAPTANSGNPPIQSITLTPDMAASFDALVSSDPSLLGATGRPQFVEFFAYW